MRIRRVRPGEESELWELFFHTVRVINRRDYSDAQVRAWAPDVGAPESWRIRIVQNAPLVCLQGDQIVGFGDLQATGYIDQFFVHHQWQGRGIGSRLFARLEARARRQGLAELSSNVSLTARPFFESRGFRIIRAQEVTIDTVTLANFQMAKRLTDA